MKHKHLTAIALTTSYLLLNLTMLLWEGVWHSVDTSRYLNQSDILLKGQEDPIAYYYITYILFLAICQKLMIGWQGVALLQILCSTAAFWGVYRMLQPYIGSWALLPLLWWILFYNLWKWNTTLMTESLYLSLSVGWGYALLHGRQSYKMQVASWLFSVVLAGLRPNGWGIFGIQLLWQLQPYLLRSRQQRIGSLLIAMVCLGGVLLVPFTRQMIAQQSFVHWQYGTLVWGYWQWHWVPNWAGISQQSVFAIWEVGRLAAMRLILELSGIRPYFSMWHNIAVGVFMVTIHGSAIATLFQKRWHPLQQLALAVTCVQWGIVAATFADWEGRFAYQVMPFTFILAAWQWATFASKQLRQKQFMRKGVSF